MSGDQLDLDATPEQAAREILDRMGVEGALSMSSGDVVEIANVIAEVRRLRANYTLATDAQRLNDRYAKARNRNNELAAEVARLRAFIASGESSGKGCGNANG